MSELGGGGIPDNYRWH